MKQIRTIEELNSFKSNYEAISGIETPIEYLKNAEVFIFQKDKKMIGGFVLNYKLPLRTVQLFAAKANHSKINQEIYEEKYCEVCCFWIERKYRKKLWLNSLIWLKMAYKVRTQSKPYIILGTNSKGLAYMYGYPKVALLYHQDRLNNKNTYIFLSRKKDFFTGVGEIVWAKLLRKRRKRNIVHRPELQKSLIYEIRM